MTDKGNIKMQWRSPFDSVFFIPFQKALHYCIYSYPLVLQKIVLSPLLISRDAYRQSSAALYLPVTMLESVKVLEDFHPPVLVETIPPSEMVVMFGSDWTEKSSQYNVGLGQELFCTVTIISMVSGEVCLLF